MFVQPVSDTTLRVSEVPWMIEEFDYDDVIEVEALDGVGESFLFVQVVLRSELDRMHFVLTRTAADSDLTPVLDRVVQAGGYWELSLGGGLFVALPPGASVDVKAALSDF